MTAANSKTDIKKSLALLGIDSRADLDQAKQAYREKVKAFHPDHVMGDEAEKHIAEEKLKQINLAYEAVTSFLSAPKAAAPGSNVTAAPKPQEAGSPGHQDMVQPILEELMALWSSLSRTLRNIDFKAILKSLTADPPAKKTPGPGRAASGDFDQVLDDILTTRQKGRIRGKGRGPQRQRSRPMRGRRNRHAAMRHRQWSARPRSGSGEKIQKISRISPIHRICPKK